MVISNKSLEQIINSSFGDNPMKTKQEFIEELLRKISPFLNPFKYETEIEWLSNNKVRRDLFEKKPKCFLVMRIGEKIILIPICNKLGSEDPKIIQFSLKLINRLSNREDVDRDEVIEILRKLNMLNKKFSSDSPKPADRAAQKANNTKLIINLKKMVDKLRQRRED